MQEVASFRFQTAMVTIFEDYLDWMIVIIDNLLILAHNYQDLYDYRVAASEVSIINKHYQRTKWQLRLSPTGEKQEPRKLISGHWIRFLGGSVECGPGDKNQHNLQQCVLIDVIINQCDA